MGGSLNMMDFDERFIIDPMFWNLGLLIMFHFSFSVVMTSHASSSPHEMIGYDCLM